LLFSVPKNKYVNLKEKGRGNSVAEHLLTTREMNLQHHPKQRKKNKFYLARPGGTHITTKLG
jgi:hypothetical protein